MGGLHLDVKYRPSIEQECHAESSFLRRDVVKIPRYDQEYDSAATEV